MRVHELAKEYEIKSTEFLTEIQGYGINVFSHLSGLSDDEVTTIRQKKEEPLATSLGAENLERDNWTLGSEDSVIEPPKVGIPTGEIVDVDRCTSDDEESDTELSFGQKAFAKAKAEETEKEGATEIKEVMVEKPRGFWGWLGSLFT